MTKIRPIRWCFLTELILASLASTQAHGQSLGFNIGYYFYPDPAKPTGYPQFTLDRKPSFGFDLYFRHVVNTDRNTRLGLQLHFARARSKPVNPDEVGSAAKSGYKYQMTSFLFSYQRKVYHKDFFYVMLGLSAGPCFRTSKSVSGHGSGCEVPFCNLPDLGLSFQPGLYTVFRLNRIAAIQISGRINYLLTEDDFYPFSSGFIVEGGLLLIPLPGR